MGKDSRKLRLDEILINEGLITEAQIKEALARQKKYGGKFGSHLLHSGYVDEAGLVKALARQFGCDGVVLSKLDIPEIILKFIPRRLAIARRIIPFDYDLEENVLKIACEDPNDESLVSEINFVARGKKVRFYIAAELALDNAIARFYLSREVSPGDNLLAEIAENEVDRESKEVPSPAPAATAKGVSDSQHQAVLLVTDDSISAPLLRSILEQDRYRVILTDSADDAIEMLGGQEFEAVFIKDTVPGDYLDLIDRLRKISPSTRVTYYESAASLLISDDSQSNEENLLRRNLELYTYLLNARDKLPVDHTCILGRYVDMLCRRMEIPHKDRLSIVNAAYIHDVARHYYSITDGCDRQQTADLTVRLLKSLGYSPVVIAMLRSMYKDLKGKYNHRLPIEILGGNILSVVDTFCRSFPATERLSLDKLDAAQKKLRTDVGTLFLSEVVEAFVALLKDEILKLHTEQNYGQIMLFSRIEALTATVEARLKGEGFRIISTDSVAKFAELYERSRPDVIILAPDTEVSHLTNFFDELSSRDIDFEKTPTFIMKNSVPSTTLLSLFELGIEDVVPTDGNFELLVAKIYRIVSQLRSRVKHQALLTDQSGCSNGSLGEMNLTELMQALTCAQRTAKLTVTPADSGESPLLVVFGYGAIVFARQDSLVGEEAIYRAAAWTEGTWSVETVSPDDLPDSNIERSDETIKINTFRILEEKLKSGQPT